MTGDRDVRHRRCRPGRRQGGGGAARRGVRRPLVLIGAEAAPALRAAAAVQGLPAGQGRAGQGRSSTREGWYAEHDVDLRLRTEVTGARPARPRARRSAAASGCGYDKLLLATGAAPRRLTLPGADLDGVALPAQPRRQRRPQGRAPARRAGRDHRRRLDRAGDGGGRPGRRGRGHRAGDAPSCRCCGCSAPQVATVFADLHRGPRRRPAPAVSAWPSCVGARRRAAVTGVGSATAPCVDADLVVVGVGIAPNVGLAARRRARRRQRHPRRRAPAHRPTRDVFAAGDVANAYHPMLRPAHPRRALGQRAAPAGGRREVDARAGRRVTTGCRTSSPTSTTSAWSTSGYAEPDGYDRGRLPRRPRRRASSSRSGSRGTRSLAGMNVNVWDVTDRIRDLILGREARGRVRAAGPVSLIRQPDPRRPAG